MRADVIAFWVRLAVAVAASIAVVGAFWIAAWWAPLFVLIVPATMVAALAGVLALEFTFAWAVARASDGQPPAIRYLLGAWGSEIRATCRLMAWRIPVRSERFSQASPAGPVGVRGLVLVHGYGCNRAIWNSWLAQLDNKNVPCTAINLEPVFAALNDYGALIESAVLAMQRQTGSAPVLVAHSMGGLAARAWWARCDSARSLHRLITIATPHHGTLMARLGSGPNARQMRPRSDWLRRLSAQESTAHADRTLCFYSDCDNMVMPCTVATLPGADNRKLTGWGHVAMVDHPDIFTAAMACLREPD